MRAVRFSGASVFASILMVLVITGGAVLYAYAWRGLLTAGGIRLPVSIAYVIMARSAIAKYLPGNVFQYLGRVGLGRTYGIPIDVVVVSTAAETIFLLVGAVGVASWGLPRLVGFAPRLNATSAWIAPAAVLGVLALLMILSVPRWRRSIGAWLAANAGYFAPHRAGLVVLVTVLELGAVGACLALLNASLWPGTPNVSWVDFASGFSAAWIAGFVVPGVPSGIGVRELILYELLGLQLGAANAVQLFLLARLLTTAADGLVFALSYLVPRPHSLTSQ
jgi:hypothetical protein